MTFYSAGGSGGTSLTSDQKSAIVTASKWELYTTDPEGIAVPVGKIRAIWGNKTYTDQGGVWALDADQNLTYKRIAGNAPAGLPAGMPTGSNAENGDQAIMEYDDVEIALSRVANAWVEENREIKAQSSQSGVAKTITQSAGIALSEPTGPLHTQPFIIDSTGTQDGTYTDSSGATMSFVNQPIAAPTKPDIWLWITRKGPHALKFIGTVNGAVDDVYHNQDFSTAKLHSGDGSGWTAYR